VKNVAEVVFRHQSGFFDCHYKVTGKTKKVAEQVSNKNYSQQMINDHPE
jgi:hypothetical protein